MKLFQAPSSYRGRGNCVELVAISPAAGVVDLPPAVEPDDEDPEEELQHAEDLLPAPAEVRIKPLWSCSAVFAIVSAGFAVVLVLSVVVMLAFVRHQEPSDGPLGGSGFLSPTTAATGEDSSAPTPSTAATGEDSSAPPKHPHGEHRPGEMVSPQETPVPLDGATGGGSTWPSATLPPPEAPPGRAAPGATGTAARPGRRPPGQAAPPGVPTGAARPGGVSSTRPSARFTPSDDTATWVEAHEVAVQHVTITTPVEASTTGEAAVSTVHVQGGGSTSGSSTSQEVAGGSTGALSPENSIERKRESLPSLSPKELQRAHLLYNERVRFGLRKVSDAIRRAFVEELPTSELIPKDVSRAWWLKADRPNIVHIQLSVIVSGESPLDGDDLVFPSQSRRHIPRHSDITPPGWLSSRPFNTDEPSFFILRAMNCRLHLDRLVDGTEYGDRLHVAAVDPEASKVGKFLEFAADHQASKTGVLDVGDNRDLWFWGNQFLFLSGLDLESVHRTYFDDQAHTRVIIPLLATHGLHVTKEVPKSITNMNLSLVLELLPALLEKLPVATSSE